MGITAKLLHLDGPVIVASHLVRIPLVILASPCVFRLLSAVGIVPAIAAGAPSRVAAE